MIYFDCAATSYPKPPAVYRAANEAMLRYGGNPGRSGHRLSMAAAEAVYAVREKAAAMFGAQPENVIFTSNCTHSLNMAIKGLAEPYLRAGRRIHFIISDLEHNSVARPVHELKKRGAFYSVASTSASDEDIPDEFERLINPFTKAVVCTLGSNVTGRLLPFRRIGELCRKKNICFIADGAQVCGVVPVNMDRDGINILCMPGHKGLFGISGTGLMITDGKYPVYHIMEGGTGSTSSEIEQTPFLPEGLESGTVNTVGIVTVGAGMDFISRMGEERIHQKEEQICETLIQSLEGTRGVTVYRDPSYSYLPIVLFNIEGYQPEEAAGLLSERGFALRGGLHCSAAGHKAAGTFPLGGIRFAPSIFNTPCEARLLAQNIKELAAQRGGLAG